MRADLHVHSRASDGTDPPAEVMRWAARAGLDVVALTDHDTVAGHAEARRALSGPLASLSLLPGMELSCRFSEPGGGQQSAHLLAYLFDPDHPGLAAELSRIRDDRVLRARAMVRRLADLGVDVSWDQVAAIAGPAVVGRPHIARAMAASGAIASPREAFTRDWIADGGRAYVGRYALDPLRAIRLVHDAGGVTVLAHPRADRDTRVPDEQIAGLAAVGLAGVEVFHPDQSDTERTPLLALASDLGLVATGGSDDHGSLTGHRIGCETTDGQAYQALLARVPVSVARSRADLPLRVSCPDGPLIVVGQGRSARSAASPRASRKAGARSATPAWAVSTCTIASAAARWPGPTSPPSPCSERCAAGRSNRNAWGASRVSVLAVRVLRDNRGYRCSGGGRRRVPWWER